ncbi:MAG: hypothetical protein IJ081_05040 [Prevotella sp.]|nr:hypothetical protein [Prevotella sp.]
MKYKLLKYSLLSLLVMLCGNVFADYEKVTSTDDITSGKYLIVYEAANVAFNGALDALDAVNDTVAIEIANNKIASTEAIDNAFFKIDVTMGTLQSASGKYIGVSSNSNSLKVTSDASAYKNAFSIDEDGNAVIAAVFEGSTMTLRYNKASNQNRFRYYKSGQEAIQLYKMVEGGQTDTRATTTLTLTFVDGIHKKEGVVGDELELPQVKITAGETEIKTLPTWSSSDPTVADYYEGKVKLYKAGTTTMTANYAGDATYKPSSESYTLTVTEKAAEPEDYNYVYDFTEKVFTAKEETKALGDVNWSLEMTSDDAEGYFGYDGTKGQQFGSGKKSSKALKLFTNGISGKIKKILVNTSGAADIAANLTVTVGESGFVCNASNSVSLTSTATDYVFTGDASGLVVLTFEQTSSKAIYIKSIKVAYEEGTTPEPQPEPASFKDIKANLTSTSLIPESAAQWDDVSTGIAVAADGTLSRVAKDAENAAAVFNGKWHGTQYGWANFTASVPVQGTVKITYGNSNYGSEVIVTNAAGAEVAKLNNKADNTWDASNTDRVAVAYYRTNEATTLSFSKCDYVGYFAVEAIDPADLPAEVTTYTVTFAAGDATGTVPADVEVNAGEKIKAPQNYGLYKEGYTLTGWTDGETTYKPGDEIAPTANLNLTAVFAQNSVSLADRTEAVTIDFNLSGYASAYAQYKFEGKNGFIVTQAAIGKEVIDVIADVDATNGKFAANGTGWHQVNTGTKVIVPSCKDAIIAVTTYNDATSMTFNGGTDNVETNESTANYYCPSSNATATIEQVSNNYWNRLMITLPVVSSEEPEPQPQSGALFSWEGNADGAIQTGGTASATDASGADLTSEDINVANSTFSVIRLRGAKDFSTNVVKLTLDNELKEGDKIAITGYRNKNAANKQTGALLKFDKGGTATTATTGLEFVNIDTSDASAEDSNRGTEPNTIELTVPEAADGSTVITMTRAITGTNLFITKIEITGERGGSVEPEPGPEPEPQPSILAEDITATWDFTNATVVEAVVAFANTNEAGTIKSVEDNGLLLTVEANGKNIRNNGNSIQTGDGVVFKVPVQSNKDVVTVVGYAAPYFAYSIGGIDATEATTVYTAKTSDVAKGYVEIVNKGQYLISIKVEQKSPYQEKELYATDFSDWTAAKAATSESTVTKTTKYSKETLNFSIYNTAVMSVTDTKFAGYTELPHMAWQANKAADPYVTTSKLASVTKVRFIHGATGSNRGWKLEAKGDGDKDWVVISDATANPAAWSEVTADVNRTNVQLRWTNLTNNQNAYMFELAIYGKVDMSNTPALGTFKANGVEYIAGDIFTEQADGTMAATIELSKKEQMISDENPISDITADNGEIGTVTYRSTEVACTVIIPVTLGEATLNYVANFVQKPDFTLTYYNTDGTTMGTQLVEKDAKIGAFAYDYNNAIAPESEKVRGWFVAADGGRKFTTSDVITANTNLYAVKTAIELASPNDRYTFDLNDQYFYAEDHEAFEPIGSGKFHDTTHGWAFNNGDKVNIIVGGEANIVLYLCNYSAEAPITLTNTEGTEVAKIENAKVSPDGAIETLKYTGEAGILTINFNGTCYVHKMIIANQSQPLYAYDAETKTYTVTAGKVAGFLGALDEANGTGDATIYLPNGTYDLGNDCLTTISGKNITIKGESQDGVIIVNTPTAEGIGVTATLLNTSQYLTLEKLTLKNAYPYYDPATGKAAANAGRAVCLQDKGNYTVCRNVTMLSYQDTYYSANNSAQLFFKDCEIHGLVDFVCGGGDVYFETTTFYLESREMTEGAGGVTIAAPNGAKQFGYVMNGCTVDCHSKEFNWGRAWGSYSGLLWMNTILKQPSKLVSSRFTAAGMNASADAFYEYNTIDEGGNVISPASNVIEFTHSTGNKKYETILTAEQAERYTKAVIFADAPEEFKKRINIEETVGVKSIDQKKSIDTNAIYNLNGQRVEKPTKGLYIIGNKKVFIK